jgi:hypothetical protein
MRDIRRTGEDVGKSDVELKSFLRGYSGGRDVEECDG